MKGFCACCNAVEELILRPPGEELCCCCCWWKFNAADADEELKLLGLWEDAVGAFVVPEIE
jgi:hypothetical protein